MTKSPATDSVEHNLPVLSVSEISQALKSMVEDSFPHVRVRGEISGFKRAASGHLYFALKDEDAVLDSVCWRGTAGRLALAPEDGLEVIITGRLSTYPGRSRYQIVVDEMELAGEGALLKLFEERKKKLAEEGLFDEDLKKDLPFIPTVIGVVTSPTGAVIRDILHRIDDRFPCRVLLWPVLVQGKGAAEQVAQAITGFDGLRTGGPVPRPDVLIVARGGGSLEDLWAFNEETVVRAAAACEIPLISAVGHETDVTLLDFVADQRAPTPTAAAEFAVPVRIELLAQVMDDGARLVNAMARCLEEKKVQLAGLARGLPNLRRVLEEAAQRLDDWVDRLRNSLGTGLDRRRGRLMELVARLPDPRQRINYAASQVEGEARAMHSAVRTFLREHQARMNQAAALLESFSYQKVLQRGFVLVRDSGGRPVQSVSVLGAGMGLGLRFHDGEAAVTVDGAPREKPTKPKEPRTRPKKRKGGPGGDDGQGTLL